MPTHRMQHTFENIKREIVAIVRQLNDPRVSNNFIDLIKIDISRDMSLCSVYVSSIHGIEKTNEAVSGLKCAVPYIKKELGLRLRLRFIPNLRFIATDSVEYGVNMMEKINNLIST